MLHTLTHWTGSGSKSANSLLVQMVAGTLSPVWCRKWLQPLSLSGAPPPSSWLLHAEVWLLCATRSDSFILPWRTSQTHQVVECEGSLLPDFWHCLHVGVGVQPENLTPSHLCNGLPAFPGASASVYGGLQGPVGACPTPWPSLSRKGLDSAPSLPQLWLPWLQIPPPLPTPQTLKHEVSARHPALQLLCLTPSASSSQGSHLHPCLPQLGHPAPFCSFLPSPAAPAVWRLSYDILRLYT